MPTLVDADKALERLRDGNARFVRNQLDGPRTDPEYRLALTHEQDPFAVIVSCADSRVVPEVLFDQGLGDLFIIRVAGNVANSSSIASVEYAVASIDVRLVLVLGHTACGAVTAARDSDERQGNLGRLLTHIDPVIDPELSLTDVIRANAQHQATQMLKRSPAMQAVPGLRVESAVYDLHTGVVEAVHTPT